MSDNTLKQVAEKDIKKLIFFKFQSYISYYSFAAYLALSSLTPEDHWDKIFSSFKKEFLNELNIKNEFPDIKNSEELNETLFQAGLVNEKIERELDLFNKGVKNSIVDLAIHLRKSFKNEINTETAYVFLEILKRFEQQKET